VAFLAQRLLDGLAAHKVAIVETEIAASVGVLSAFA
jgi:hypothetical protein